MNLIRTILIFVIIYYSFRVITRYIIPFFAREWVKKAQENFKEQQGYVDPEEARKREGEVKVKPKSQNSNSKTNKEELGDYIDYEEIKEK